MPEDKSLSFLICVISEYEHLLVIIISHLLNKNKNPLFSMNQCINI